MRNKKTIKEFRAFYIMASSVYAKSSRKRKSGVIVQCNKKHGRPSSEHPLEVIIPRITVKPGILCGTAEGDVVLDPFVGSGTSCRVANRYGRQYIGD